MNGTILIPNNNSLVKMVSKGYEYDKERGIQMLKEFHNNSGTFDYHQTKFDYHYHSDVDNDPYFPNM